MDIVIKKSIEKNNKTECTMRLWYC